MFACAVRVCLAGTSVERFARVLRIALQAKNNLLPLAAQENWLCFFYHDFEMPICRLTQKEGKFSAQEISLD
jgi:hypothetical protein